MTTVATIRKCTYQVPIWRGRVTRGRVGLSMDLLERPGGRCVAVASHVDFPMFDSVSLLLVLLSRRSNDDLALRKEFYSSRRLRDFGRGEGSKAKLTAAEVLVLCWERGLLRSQQWPDAQSRRKATSGSAGGAAAAVDEPIPEAAAKAMLRR